MGLSPVPTAWPRGSGNLLLERLPSADRELLAPHLDMVKLEMGASLHDADTIIRHVYFPHQGLVSVLGVLTDGSSVETAIIGREGMVGMAVFHGTDRLAERAVIRLQGSAQRMTSESLRICVASSSALRAALHHYAACMFVFAAQSVACMSKHETNRRLARWLLHASDQSGSDDLELTHLFLSHMLGVRRSSISVAASALRTKGLITYTRKRIDITDREGLAGHSCECYNIVRSTYDRLMFSQQSVNPLPSTDSSRDGMSVRGSPYLQRVGNAGRG